MKSIIQEASSIKKAIEKAWIKAEKPKEFSVKILEEPIKNFFGLTKKMAKIALFFGGPIRDSRPSGQHHRYRRRHHRRPHYQDQTRQDQQGQRQFQHQRPQHPQSSSTSSDTRVNNHDKSNNGSSQ